MIVSNKPKVELLTSNIQPSNTIQICELNINLILANKFILIIGKCGSGKTSLCKDILRQTKPDSFSLVFVPHGGIEECSNVKVEEHFSHRDIETFIERQKSLQISRMGNPGGLLICDDTVTPNEDVAYNHRHYDFTTLYCHQNLDMLPISYLYNTSGIFITQNSNEDYLKHMYNRLINVVLLPTFDIFKDIVQAVTQNYMTLYIDLETNHNHWTERMYWYKATI